MNKRFNVILDSPPTNNVGDVYFSTDFKTVLTYFRIFQDETLSDEEKAEKMLYTFFPKGFPRFDHDKILDNIVYLISRGEEQKASGEVVFDWDADAGRVYAAFLQTYNIDLLKVDLHWWIFKDLFDALPAETKLREVINIRSTKISAKDTPEYRRAVLRMKEAYEIKSGKNPDIFNCF